MKKMKKTFVIILLLAGCMQLQAQERKPWVLRALNAVKTYIDSSAVKGIDPRYLEVPEKPWAVMLKSNANDMDLRSTTYMSEDQLAAHNVTGELNFETKMEPKREVSIGGWIGYRGYGLGYSVNVGGNKGSLFKLGATGGSYGVNLRIHRFETDEPTVHFEYDDISGAHESGDGHYYLIDPMYVKVVSLDAYYLLNGKRFSYCAAYDQSVFQKRSAGSFMVGAMYYKSTIIYDNNPDADFILMMNDIGKIKQYQFAIGPGYAYNFVPCKGLLISAMAMPMITVSNKIDVWHYNSNLRKAALSDDDADIDMEDYVIYPSEGANKIYYPYEKEFKTSHRSDASVILDARLSVTYNTGNWFFNTNALLNRFRFEFDTTKGHLTDWSINACVGIRL